MAKLSKAQTRAHNQALEILRKDRLNEADREFVFENWQEAANHMNGQAGAFFTPMGLAWDLAIDVGGRKILDLCAGIGVLGYAAFHRGSYDREQARQITCVEINPDYVEVGRKLLPEATWICADAFSDLSHLGRFDWVVANPPFGAINGRGDFDLAIVERAADFADDATFILPAGSVPFAYSGRPCYDDSRPSDKARRFRDRTRIDLRAGCGVDCSFYRDEWRNTAPAVEIACADYAETRTARAALCEPILLHDGPELQHLVPGVAPVAPTVRQLAQEAQRRLSRRGAAPLPSGGLFDDAARLQQDLF